MRKLEQSENKVKLKEIDIKPITKYLELENELSKSNASPIRSKTDILIQCA